MIYEGIWHDLVVCAVGAVLYVCVAYRAGLVLRRVAASKGVKSES
jgi:hypothetical protein